MKNRGLWLICIVAVAAVLFAACGSEDIDANQGAPEGAGPDSVQAGGEQATRSVKHAFGEIDVPAAPQRIAHISDMGWEDNLLAMGVKPYIASTFTWSADRFYPHLAEQLRGVHGIDGHEPNIEQLLVWQPDLIIVNGQIEKVYEQLNRIAPTVMLEFHPDWRVTHGRLGEVIGKEAEAVRALEEYDRYVEAVKADIAAIIGDKSVLFVIVNDKLFRIQGLTGHALNDLLYLDLGLTPAAGIPTQEQRVQVSLEGLTTFDADYIFLYENKFSDSAPLAAELKKSGVWNNMTAVKNGRVIEVEDNWMAMSQGPQGRMMIVEQIQKALAAK